MECGQCGEKETSSGYLMHMKNFFLFCLVLFMINFCANCLIVLPVLHHLQAAVWSISRALCFGGSRTLACDPAPVRPRISPQTASSSETLCVCLLNSGPVSFLFPQRILLVCWSTRWSDPFDKFWFANWFWASIGHFPIEKRYLHFKPGDNS